MTSQSGPSLRAVAGGLAVIDLAMVVLVSRRSRLATPFLGPPDEDLSAWSRGAIATYTLAQAAIAVRPTPGGARVLATLRGVLIGGDLMLATRGRGVDRRCGVVAAIGNALFAIAAMRSVDGWGGGRITRMQDGGRA